MTNLQEIWKEIPYLKGRYEASTFGRIRNLRTGHILRTPVNYKSDGVGYNRFTTIQNNILSYHYVQRVVMDTFKPIKDSWRFTVDHNDFNRQNNRLDNLSWKTQLENNQHSRSNGRYISANKKHSEWLKEASKNGSNPLVNYNTGKFGELSNSAKLTNDDVVKIRELRSSGKTCTEIGKIFGVCHQSISNICLKKSWNRV